MFIETLEFTIPVELCNVFSNLQKGQRSNVEFPASVNSYGTTQDANIQVVLRSNKLTFKVDGVSSNSSMISKSECKTLKLSVFDVDHTLMPEEEEQQQQQQYDYNSMVVQQTVPMSSAAKRLHEQSVSLPPAKSSRTSYGESPRPRSPQHRRSHPQPSPRSSQNSNSHSKPHNDTPVNVKQEPEDPDLIEIEPDPEPDDIVPKKETPYMQIDYSSDVPHTQTSQAALERLSHPHSSHSQSPASSSSSFHQNVPHVQDYSEPGPSHHSQNQHGDQNADDFLVFQHDDNEDGDDNDIDYGNDDEGSSHGFSLPLVNEAQTAPVQPKSSLPFWDPSQYLQMASSSMGINFIPKPTPTFRPHKRRFSDRVGSTCQVCGKVFATPRSMYDHKAAVHDNVSYVCICGKKYKYRPGLKTHHRTCIVRINSLLTKVE